MSRYRILRLLEANPNASQRKIAEYEELSREIGALRREVAMMTDSEGARRSGK
jgi:hypothetical protein